MELNCCGQRSSEQNQGHGGDVCYLATGLSLFTLRRLLTAVGVDRHSSAASNSNSNADEEAIKQTFVMFDLDGSGEIDKDEMRQVAKKLGVPMSGEYSTTAGI